MEVLVFRPACRTHQQRGTIRAKSDFAVFIHLREESLLSRAGKAELGENALEERVPIGKRSGVEEGGSSIVENGSLDVPLRSKPVLKMGSEKQMDFHGLGNAEIAVAALSEEVFDPFRNADDYACEREGKHYEDGLFREKVRESCIWIYKKNKGKYPKLCQSMKNLAFCNRATSQTTNNVGMLGGF